MKFAMRTRELLAVAFLTTGVALPPQASAQDAPQNSAPAAEATDISEDKLQSFVVAFRQVETVKQDFTQRLQEAGSDEEMQTLRNEAGQQMLQAVEDADGISVDEYNQILRSAQGNPDLAQRLTDAIGQSEGGTQQSE